MALAVSKRRKKTIWFHALKNCISSHMKDHVAAWDVVTLSMHAIQLMHEHWHPQELSHSMTIHLLPEMKWMTKPWSEINLHHHQRMCWLLRLWCTRSLWRCWGLNLVVFMGGGAFTDLDVWLRIWCTQYCLSRDLGCRWGCPVYLSSKGHYPEVDDGLDTILTWNTVAHKK